MNAKADLAIWALDVLARHAPEPLTYEGRPLENVGGVVLATAETARELRRYVGDPAVDQFKRQCERDAEWREAHSEDEPAERAYKNDEQFFLSQQCPADSNFR
jgi:hypothetical protein